MLFGEAVVDNTLNSVSNCEFFLMINKTEKLVTLLLHILYIFLLRVNGLIDSDKNTTAIELRLNWKINA